MAFTPKYRRADGTFVIALDVPGRGVLDYHVTRDDPLFPAAAAASEGVGLADEPQPEPLPPDRRITVLAFMDRLTRQKQGAVVGAALASPAVMLWLLRLAGASFVDLDAPETAEGVAALLGAGVITADDAVALVA